MEEINPLLSVVTKCSYSNQKTEVGRIDLKIR